MARAARWTAPRVLAALGALAMLTPLLTPLAASDLAAYRPDHGHLQAAGDAVPPHDHPWDEQHRAPGPDAATLFDALTFHPVARDIPAQPAPAGAEQEHAGIVFTHVDDGSPGSASSLAVPSAATPLAASSTTLREGATASPAPPDIRLAVPTEPPRA